MAAKKKTTKRGAPARSRGKSAAASRKAVKPPVAPAAAPHADGAWAQFFSRAPGEQRFWLVKSEPTTFSFDDLLRRPGRTTGWDGVRNFVARNFLRDGMKIGDRVFFYHSSTDPQAIVGICEVSREGHADKTALDASHEHFDPDSDPAAPRWFQVDLRAVAQFTHPVTLGALKARAELRNMAMLRIGRLSVTPVTATEWGVICKMAG